MPTSAQKTLKLFEVTTIKVKNMILDNIANHYGITREETYEEVTHEEAESVLDYITGPERAYVHEIMYRNGIM
jgi:hypothetical protein